jgi:hypothetical protein
VARRDVPRTYTILTGEEPIRDADGKVIAGTFAGITRPLPTVADEITVSEVGVGRPSLWWLPQDLAIGGGLEA